MKRVFSDLPLPFIYILNRNIVQEKLARTTLGIENWAVVDRAKWSTSENYISKK